MQQTLSVFAMAIMATSSSAQNAVPYDVERLVSAIESCSELSFEWLNPATGKMAETRVFPNDDETCTYHVRATPTFHTVCALSEEQRGPYATELLRQANAESIKTNTTLQDGEWVTTYTINGETFRSHISDAHNDGTCENYSTDPESPLFKAPEDRK